MGIYRIDKFLKYYDSLKDNQMEIEKGIWVNAKPLPFCDGFLTKDFWKEIWSRIKNAWVIIRGNGDVVTWK